MTLERHLKIAKRPALVYAIGDVHGRLDLLLALEAKIVRDAGPRLGESLVVMLGDYVDRGAESAGVIRHLMATPENFDRIALAGNHDVMMARAGHDEDIARTWLANGATATLVSYGFDFSRLDAVLAAGPGWNAVLTQAIAQVHLDWLAQRPFTLSMPGYVFSHAGHRRDMPMDRQTERDLIWARYTDADFAPRNADDPIIVHGHTPARDPRITPGRIGIDTGAFDSNRLTALRIDEHGRTAFLST
jgi:serine/threonine protein phosphatase 1